MPRSKTHAPLNVLINGRLVGELGKRPNGAIQFKYDPGWLAWEHRFAVSLSLPLKKSAYRGYEVVAVFDNLLPDSDQVRRVVAERTGAAGTDVFSLLEQLGRDCVGAMQFIPAGQQTNHKTEIQGEPLSEQQIERLLRNLSRAPLGVDPEHEFRISIAGAQQKTALLFHKGKWMLPVGPTPTTHILKPQIGTIPTSTGVIDMRASVDNEHYCLKVLEACGLPVNRTSIQTFGDKRVLVAERFDRRWTSDGRLLRLPQEDFCQALGVPSTRKYQSTVAIGPGGPSNVDIAHLLKGSDSPLDDRMKLLKSQIVFWLLGATDGHAKNFSIFLNPGGRFSLTPFYDVLSAQPAFDAGQIPHNQYKLAMSVGKRNHYRIAHIRKRHFEETGQLMGLGKQLVAEVIEEVRATGASAADRALEKMPDDFERSIHETVGQGIALRLARLDVY